jgi:hypothetical protein
MMSDLNLDSYYDVSEEKRPLLIAPKGRLPTNQVVAIPPTESLSEWIDAAHQVWLGLDKPSVRFFLPESFDMEEFQSLWPSSANETDITLVPEQSRLTGS